eukprot:gene28684-biopygen54671
MPNASPGSLRIAVTSPCFPFRSTNIPRSMPWISTRDPTGKTPAGNVSEVVTDQVGNKEKARFCVVVVAPAKTCYNVRHRCTPEMPAPGKRDPQYGDKEIRGDQSIWVVRSLDEGGKVANAASDQGC